MNIKNMLLLLGIPRMSGKSPGIKGISGVIRGLSGRVQGLTRGCQGIYCNIRGNPFKLC